MPMKCSLGCTELASVICSQKLISVIKILEMLDEENNDESGLGNAVGTSVGDKRCAKRGGSQLESCLRACSALLCVLDLLLRVR